MERRDRRLKHNGENSVCRIEMDTFIGKFLITWKNFEDKLNLAMNQNAMSEFLHYKLFHLNMFVD